MNFWSIVEHSQVICGWVRMKTPKALLFTQIHTRKLTQAIQMKIAGRFSGWIRDITNYLITMSECGLQLSMAMELKSLGVAVLSFFLIFFIFFNENSSY